MIDAKPPNRLHHTAYVTSDLEATRRFYEDVIGFPLVATWCEREELFGRTRTYCHCFFGMADGSALAFFQFADPQDQAQFGPSLPSSPFRHIAVEVDAAMQEAILSRLKASGYGETLYVLEHGYCRSVYVTDPNGMIVEFAVDAPDAEAINTHNGAVAHQELRRWMAGDHTPNNRFRADAEAS